jgi:RNA polymerase sigma-70 factor (ECF subfamily)
VTDTPRTTSGEVASQELLQQLQTSYGVLLHWMRRKLGDRELAADLLNDAVVIVLENQRSGRLRHVDNLAGYVIRVGMNLLRNHRRKHENRVGLRADSAEIDKESEPPSDAISDAHLQQLTRQLLESLSSTREREIIQQFYLEEHDKAAIGAHFELSLQQINLILSRARHKMKTLLEASGVRQHDLLCLTLPWLLAALFLR